MSLLEQYAIETERLLEKCFRPENGLMCFSLKLDTLTPWEESDFTEKECVPQITAYEDMNFAHFMNYENTGMVLGTYLAALCFQYKATGRKEVLEKAARTFRSIELIYDMSGKIAPGFYCKPWGGHVTDETSSDQYIYTMSGLDEYYVLAPESEQAKIREMIPAMARFWLDRKYEWNYYGKPLRWRECRFIAFMALALKYEKSEVFEKELQRLTALQIQDETTPFRSTRKEALHKNPDGSEDLNSCPEAALSTFLSLEEAMKQNNCERFMQICFDSIEHGTECLAGDGTVYGPRVRKTPEEPFHEIPVEETFFSGKRNPSPIFFFHAPYRKGGMQTTMFGRCLLAFDSFAPDQSRRDKVKEILLQTGTKHLTWFEDPYGVFPEELKWMTNVFSGDAAAHFLWCYWKLRLMQEV
ncbi:MAG: hypothetical protein J6S58_03355 [Lentisphaeria bacterium]|nr:hypothetical protein [Lentisphaeria bacterium]